MFAMFFLHFAWSFCLSNPSVNQISHRSPRTSFEYPGRKFRVQIVWAYPRPAVVKCYEPRPGGSQRKHGPCSNKRRSFQVWGFHYKDKMTVVRPSCLWKGIPTVVRQHLYIQKCPWEPIKLRKLVTKFNHLGTVFLLHDISLLRN